MTSLKLVLLFSTVTYTECSSNLPPIFTKDMNNIVIPEDIQIGEEVYKLEAIDPGSRPLEYGVQGTDLFSVDGASGVVRVAKNIDYETNTTLNFVVTVTARDEVTTDTVEQAISVIVMDANDNPPRFENETYELSIPETTPPGTVLFNVTATDQDSVGKPIQVSCWDLQENTSACEKFIYKRYLYSQTVNLNKGAIVLTARLNYSESNNYLFLLQANDGSSTSSAQVKINVVDVQDTPPKFIGSLYAEVQEDAPINSRVFTVQAMDGDVGDPRSILYELVDEANDYFQIDPMTGDVYTAKSLDREALNKEGILKLEIRAHEIINGQRGDDPATMSTAIATVKVLDVNDEVPSFNKKQYFLEIPEDVAVGYEVEGLDMVVRDLDEGNNSVLALDIEDNTGSFSIAPLIINGSSDVKLKVISDKLDYENPEQRHFTMVVTAREMYTKEKFSSAAAIIVTVTDVNDNSPIFHQPLYSASVSETASHKTLVITIVAEDKDSNLFGNGGLVYSISGPGSELFVVNNRTGTVTVASCSNPGLTPCLDFEVTREYELSFVATDNNGVGQSTSVPLKITLVDTNDNLPHFTKSLYNISFENKSEHVISASDRDTTSSLVYSILTGNEDELFKIDPESGKLSVDGKVDKDTVKLTVMVNDGRHTSTTLVNVVSASMKRPGNLILSKIGTAPFFIAPLHVLKVEEELPKGTIVFVVKALDKKSDISDYRIYPDNSYFAVDTKTGIIRVKKRLDYEEVQQVNFTVWAFDNSIPKLNTSTNMSVQVININDNDPIFTQEQYHVFIDENSPNGTLLLRVRATDKDKGQFGQVSYELVGANSQNFLINSTTGEVYVGNSNWLDHERVREFVLQVVVHDEATPRRSISTPIYVTINDLNDNPPQFSSCTYEVDIMEDVHPPMSMIQLKASDKDSAINGQVFYRLKSGNDQNIFGIKVDTGMVFVQKPLTGHSGFFNLVVEARDGAGKGNLSDVTSLIVHVINVNDHKPIFVMPYLPNSSVDVLENAASKGLIVLIVKATDKDQGDNGRVTYHLKSNNKLIQETPEFFIDEKSGELKLRRNLDREEQSRYELTIVARDHGNPKWYKEERHLTVLLVDENDNQPEFPGSLAANPYHFYVTENNEVGTLIGHVQALDHDEGQHAAIYYYILTGNEDNCFKLDKESGNLYVMCSLDREMRSDFQLTILANNDPDYFVQDSVDDIDKLGLLEDKSIAEVLVTVEDLNDNEPVFEQSIYHAAVNVMANVNQFVVNVTALDPDSGDNGFLHYYIGGCFMYKNTPGQVIRSRINPSPFVINQRGEVYTGTYLAENNQHMFLLEIFAREDGSPKRKAYTQAQIWVFEPEQLIRVLISKPKEKVHEESDTLMVELTNSTQLSIIINEIRFHVGSGGRKNEQWTDMYILAVDSAKNLIIPVTQALDIINDKFMPELNDDFGVELLVPAFIQEYQGSFDATLAALIALIIMFCIGVMVCVIMIYMRHWSSNDDLKRKDLLIKKELLESLSEETPYWIEQREELMQENDLDMDLIQARDLYDITEEMDCPNQHYQWSTARSRQLNGSSFRIPKRLQCQQFKPFTTNYSRLSKTNRSGCDSLNQF